MVKDKSGEPIIGANILEKGTSNGVITNVDGEYTLKVKGANSVLIVSYIGYKSQEIAVGSQRKIDVTLADDTELLDEVVVIGYGTQRKGDVTSAISSVKKDDFIQGKVSDAADLIKGKVAGLVVSTASSTAGAAASVTIRGASSLRGDNQPLYVIDNVPQASTGEFGRSAISGDFQIAQDPLSSLNPADICLLYTSPSPRD